MLFHKLNVLKVKKEKKMFKFSQCVIDKIRELSILAFSESTKEQNKDEGILEKLLKEEIFYYTDEDKELYTEQKQLKEEKSIMLHKESINLIMLLVLKSFLELRKVEEFLEPVKFEIKDKLLYPNTKFDELIITLKGDK